MADTPQFLGITRSKLDEKGRMVLPAKIRGQLGESGVLGMNDRCLSLWTEDGYAQAVSRMRRKVMKKELDQNVFRIVTAHAADVIPDQQGRIMIPPVLRDHAGLSREAVVIGAYDRAEIWDAGRWDQMNVDLSSEVSAALAELRI
jgi:MraZ protein